MTTYFESDRRELRAALRSITELVIENDRLKEFIRELEIALGRELNWRERPSTIRRSCHGTIRNNCRPAGSRAAVGLGRPLVLAATRTDRRFLQEQAGGDITEIQSRDSEARALVLTTANGAPSPPHPALPLVPAV